MGTVSSLPQVLSSNLWQEMLEDVRASDLKMPPLKLRMLEIRHNQRTADLILNSMSDTFPVRVRQAATRLKRHRQDQRDSKEPIPRFCVTNCCHSDCQWRHRRLQLTDHEWQLVKNKLDSKRKNVSMWVHLAETQ
jgi:hypothetical protein